MSEGHRETQLLSQLTLNFNVFHQCRSKQSSCHGQHCFRVCLHWRCFRFSRFGRTVPVSNVSIFVTSDVPSPLAVAKAADRGVSLETEESPWRVVVELTLTGGIFKHGTFINNWNSFLPLNPF